MPEAGLQPAGAELLVSRLRFWRSERRWERKQTAMFRQADVVVVAHTKSGQTWLRVMLSHLFHLRFGIPANELIQFDNFHRLDARIPKIHFTRDNRFMNRSGHRVLAMPSPAQKFLFLIRDPRDIAVSYWFHVRHRASDKELHLKGIGRTTRALSLYEFATDPGCGIGNLAQLFNRWLEESSTLAHAHFTRYEDLRSDTRAELDAIMRFIGLDASSAEIDRTVEFASFENMKKMELEQFFTSERLRATVPGNPDSMKVRSGEVAGHSKLLSAPEREFITDFLSRSLNPRFGYGVGATPLPARLRRDGALRSA